ncbi:MAG: diguanylate cyclase [Magnetococcales bacterium]|nr:diguanylate cyclase [Magnetococcales bacterium]
MSISVLFLEDDQDILDLLLPEYRSLDYTVYQALSGHEALAILQAHPIDILVTVLHTPDMDGLTWIQQAIDQKNDLQIILMCTLEDRLLAVQAMAHHAVIAVQKPVHRDELRIHMERCREIKKTQKTLRQKEALLTIEAMDLKQAEKIAERALTIRIAISALLETSLEPLSLEKHVAVILEIILAVPWLSGLRMGALFLMDEITGTLQMVGQKNLPEPLLTLCAEVPLGKCLCGQAGQSHELIFTDQVDARHEIGFAAMTPHGHYCVPIVNKERLLGVLCLHMPAGHQHKQDEDALLSTISNTLALILEHRRTESDLRKAEERLRFMAYHDPLTGLRNRQFFDTAFGKIFTILQNVGRRQHERPFQGAFLAMLDIDHFKKVNDTYGHLMGDEVLVLFARIMTECFRDKDATFRFGGEEFVVLLNDISPETAEVVLNRFRKAVESYAFPQVGRVTVSIGAVQIEAGELAGTLIEKADLALYHSKSNGRNQVNLYHMLVAAGHLEAVSHGTEEIDLW